MSIRQYKAVLSTKKYILNADTKKYTSDNTQHKINFENVSAELRGLCYEIPSKIHGDGYEPYIFEYNNDNFITIQPKILKTYKNEVLPSGLVKLVLKIELELTEQEYFNLSNYNKEVGINCYITLLHEWDGKKYILPSSLGDSSSCIVQFGDDLQTHNTATKQHTENS
tara:strand:- start:275 stop:778 length:504 start_codon:yes stop_codon:yes gene_type:complete